MAGTTTNAGVAGTTTNAGGTGGTGAGGSAGATSGGAEALGGMGAVGTGPFCEVQALLRAKCQSCHAHPPRLRSVPMGLVTYEDLIATTPSDATLSAVEMSIVRMQDTVEPMPPTPEAPATADEVQILQAWLDAGKPSTCDDGAAGAGGSGEIPPSIYDTPVICTSTTHWTGGDEESPSMHPGGACIHCHTSEGEEEGPRFTFAGTVYPSAHEPTDCNGVDGKGVTTQVVITDANGATFTLNVNSVGNFSHEARGTTVALPYTAKIVRDGKERRMATEQQSGDCNSCHTEAGAEDAPGRIMAP